MKILITGAAGFIGYHTAQRLLSEGHDVVGVDALAQSSDLELKLLRLAQLGIGAEALHANTPLSHGPFTFIRTDLKVRAVIVELCRRERFDQIIHLAAITGQARSRLTPANFFDDNVAATENVLEGARLGGVSHVFFASSSIVHGAHAKAPLTEENDVDNPLSIYAASKRMAEILCYGYAQTFRIPVTVFRLFTVYGPWGRPDSPPMLFARDIVEGKPIKVLNNGFLVRDFTYIDDVVDGICSAIACPPNSKQNVPYALYNLGRSKPVALLSFIQALEASLGSTAQIDLDPASPYAQGEAVEMYADTTKLESQLAYSPVWDYEEAVPIFIQWFKENYKTTFNM